MQEHRQEQQEAQLGADHESGRDGDAVEERVHAEPEHRQVRRRRPEKGLGVDLLPEMKMRSDGVLEEMHTEVPHEHEQERVGHVRALRQHAGEGRG